MPKKLNTEDFIKKAIIIHGNKYDYSKVIYINNYTKVIITCPIHGEFLQRPQDHLKNSGCFQCCYENKYLSTEQFIQKAKAVHGERYIYDKTKYKHNKQIVSIKCPEHGYFNQIAIYHLRGYGCSICGGSKLSTEKEFIERANKVHNNKYDYSKVKYINDKTKICIICPTHGEFKQSPLKHLSGRSCWKCKSSKGESIIRYILEKNNINYIQEYIIPGAQQRFRYDFYLTDFNLLIEFHGIQHYKAIDYFGGEEALRYNKERDIFKRELAKLANIPLIEFNYKHLKQLSIIEFEQLLLSNLSRRDKIQRVFEREEG